MNSLAITNGQSPGHLDHPGTTVQALGALVLLAKYPLLSRDELNKKILLNPEPEMRHIAFSLSLLTLIFIGIAGYVTATLFQSWLVGLLLQIIPFCSPLPWYYLMRISPDILVFGSGILFTVLLSYYHFRERKKIQPWLPVLFGSIGAFTVISKISGFTVLIIPTILFFKKIRNLLYFIMSFGATALLLTMPIFFNQWRTNLRYIYNWIRELFLIGAIGNSSSSIIASKNWLAIFSNLCIEAPIIPVGIIASLIWAIRFRSKVSFGIFIALVAQLILVALRPSGKYLFPSFGIAVWSILLWVQFYFIPKRKGLLFIGIFVFFLLAFYHPIQRLPLRAIVRNNLQDIEKSRAKAEELGCKLVRTSYGNFLSAYSPLHGFYFGNSFSRRFFEPQLMNLYGEDIFYNWSDNTFETIVWTKLSKQDLQKQKKLYCLHMSKQTMSNAPIPTDVRFQEIYTTPSGSSLFQIIWK